MVTDTAKLLRSILGEHVEIASVLADNAWAALADPSQLSAAIVNLAVNARDAMPGGGKLTLETANFTRDEVDASDDGEVKAGEFVMIAVTDTGHGIPADIRDRVFEPFFTTKGSRPRHRTWAEHGLRFCQAVRRHRRNRQRGRPWHA